MRTRSAADAPGTGDVRRRVGLAVETLTPGYFAVVMATGIISVGTWLKGSHALSTAMLVLCAVSYGVLVVLNGWRLLAYPHAVSSDFNDPRRAFGFFTFVAGTNVLGVRLGVGHPDATVALLVVSGVTWLVLGYVVPWTAVLGRQERPVVATANGTWFVWVVASQSVAVAAATVEPDFASGRTVLALLAVVSWSVGIFLYGAAGTIVAFRLMLYEFGPEELTPPYWVAMGALAITVLAGARIVEMANAPMVDATRGLVAGLAVFCWAFATWLIPVLVAAGWWRHVVRRLPLRYDATLWSMVFPMGMYGVAGIYLGRADRLPLVADVGTVSLWIAFTVWLVTFLAMVRHLWRTVVASAG
jgi:tellurite resistance protein TehA-like permease